jgi:carbonic anhydrase
MRQLLEGYRRFRKGRWAEQRALYEQLAEGQKPRLLVIACSDSRVDPTTIFNTRPGELFVIRNVANLVPPYEQGEGLHGTSAALEFAVRKLQVHTILVMGHARCGGVNAALDGGESLEGTEFLSGWVALLDAAKERIPSPCHDPHHALERESIRVSLERLMSFPFVAAAVEAGTLSLEGALFDVSTGDLDHFDQAAGSFIKIV